MSRIVAINFADESFSNAQALNADTARKNGKVDEVRCFTPNDIENAFFVEHEQVLSQKRGRGYWLWKPYITCKTLQSVDDGDYVVYTDSGLIFLNDIRLLIACMERDGQEIMLFEQGEGRVEKHWSKRDAFVLMNCDSPEFTDTEQCYSGLYIIKKSEKTCAFWKKVLFYNADYRIVSDEANVMGLPNYEGFVENRHDQTVLSLLAKKEKIKFYPDPSQYGFIGIKELPEYPQIFDIHRIGRARTERELKWLKIYMPIRNRWLRFYLGLKGKIGRKLGIIKDT